MPILSLPYTFVNGTIADANQVDADFNAVVAVVNGLDQANIGVNGIYASQIIPTSTPQATFGGTFGYVFNPGLNTVVPLTLAAPSGQTADLLDATVNAVNIMALKATGMLTLPATVGGVQVAQNGGSVQMGNAAGAGLVSRTSFTWDMLTGVTWNGSAYTAQVANPSFLELTTAGAQPFSFFADTGETIGNTYTPTKILAVTPTGVVLQSGKQIYSSNGVNSIGMAVGPVMCNGAFYNGSSFVATATTASTLTLGATGMLFISYDKSLTIGNTFAPTQQIATTLTGSGSNVLSLLMSGGGGISPGNNSTNGSMLWSGTGLPSGTLGNNGDFYFRQDNVGGTTNLYKKSGGAWSALL